MNVSSLPRLRIQMQLITLQDGRVLVHSGSNITDFIFDSDIYNPTTDTWTRAGTQTSYFIADFSPVTTLHDGRVMFCGGAVLGSGAVANTTLFDPATGLWSMAADMPIARYGHRSVTLHNGKVLACGGTYESEALNMTTSCVVWDPVADAWSSAAPMPRDRTRFTFALMNDGRAVAVNGIQSRRDRFHDVYTPIVDIYDPVADSWSTLSALANERVYTSDTHIGTDRLMITGGVSVNPETKAQYDTAVCELFHFDTLQITPCPSLNVGRHLHGVYELASGVVMVTLGALNDSVELLGDHLATTSSGTTSSGTTSSGTTSSGTSSSGTTSSGTTSSGTASSGTTSSGTTSSGTTSSGTTSSGTTSSGTTSSGTTSSGTTSSGTTSSGTTFSGTTSSGTTSSGSTSTGTTSSGTTSTGTTSSGTTLTGTASSGTTASAGLCLPDHNDRYVSVIAQSPTGGWKTDANIDVPAARTDLDTVRGKNDGQFVIATVQAGQTSTTFQTYTKPTSNPVPPTATIRGLSVSMRRMASSADIQDMMFGLILEGTVRPDTNLCANAASCAWPSGIPGMKFNRTEFGTTTTTWNLPAGALTPQLVNRPDFGVAIRVRNVGSAVQTAAIDQVHFTFYYCEEASSTTGSSGTTGLVYGSAKTYPRFVGQSTTMLGWDTAYTISAGSGSPAYVGFHSAGAPIDTSVRGHDAIYAHQFLAADARSSTLHVQRFSGQVLPAGATVLGVEFTMVRSASGVGIRDISAQLIVNGVIIPSNPDSDLYSRDRGPVWNTPAGSGRLVSIGGPTELWGHILTPAMVTSSSFGLALRISNTASVSLHAYLDEVDLIIYYSAPVGAALLAEEDLEPSDTQPALLPTGDSSTIIIGVVAAAAVAVVAIVAALVVIRRRKMSAKTGYIPQEPADLL